MNPDNLSSNYKQVIVVRRDLGMGTGKLAAQVAHAAVMAVENVKQHNRQWFDLWFSEGQAKIVVKVQSLEELTEVKINALNINLPVVQVHDSGLTQIPSGTATCIGIGPAPSHLIDRVTSSLKLL